jgi:hypothetical protein
MMGTLTLELPDEHLRKLEHLAQKRGTSIQALMIAMINDFTAQSEGDDVYDVTQDPMYSIKSHETGAPADLSQHVDDYLYGTRQP